MKLLKAISRHKMSCELEALAMCTEKDFCGLAA